jgi:hydroxyacylglutathione hydrolase
MFVKQFRYHNDNLAYLIHGKNDAIAIDGGAVHDICNFLEKNDLSLRYIFNTHNHSDHTSGNRDLMKATNAKYISINELIEEKKWMIEKKIIQIYQTPGHTMDSICFHLNHWLITGDTLFNGTVGNCFTNDEKSFVESLQKIKDLPDETIIYAGHDYVRPAMKFAKNHTINPSHIEDFLNVYNPIHVFSSLKQEKKHNPFLRLYCPEIKNLLIGHQLPVNTDFERFQSLKKIEIWD